MKKPIINLEDVELMPRHESFAATGDAATRFDAKMGMVAQAIGAQSPGEHAAAENMLTGALKSLFAVSEAYPDLKANANFLELQRELSDTENKIQAARRFYNSNVRDYNTAIEQVPKNIVANMFKFEKQEFFELDNEEEKAVPEVEFDKK